MISSSCYEVKKEGYLDSGREDTERLTLKVSSSGNKPRLETEGSQLGLGPGGVGWK